MSINVITKGFELTEAIKAYGVSEAEKATQMIRFPVSSFRISISSVNKKHLYSATCNVSFLNGIKSITVSKNDDDLYHCISEAISTIVDLAEKEHKKHIAAKKKRSRPEFKDDEFFDEE